MLYIGVPGNSKGLKWDICLWAPGNSLLKRAKNIKKHCSRPHQKSQVQEWEETGPGFLSHLWSTELAGRAALLASNESPGLLQQVLMDQPSLKQITSSVSFWALFRKPKVSISYCLDISKDLRIPLVVENTRYLEFTGIYSIWIWHSLINPQSAERVQKERDKTVNIFFI